MNSCHCEEKNLSELKKQARKALNAVAFTSVITTALSYLFYTVISVLMPFFVRLLSKLLMAMGSGSVYAMAFAENFIASEELSWFVSIAATLICFFIPFLLLAKSIMYKETSGIISFNGPVLKSLPFVYCTTLMMASAVSAVAGGIFSFVFPDAYGLINTDTVGMYGSSGRPVSLVLSFISMCIFAPIAEEFAYRGVAFGYLKKFGVSFAAISSSVLFGLAHANPEQIAYAVIFGLVLCAVTSKTDNLKTAIIMHFINNLIGYIRAYIIPLIGFDMADVVFGVIYSLTVGAFAIIGITILFKTLKCNTDVEEKASVPMVCFFCAGTVFAIILTATDILLGTI